MPYITKPNRERLDPAIAQLAQLIRELGELNYAITRLSVLKLDGMGERRYANLSAIRGVLQDAADEFYRQAMGPYEDEKRHVNGDVYKPVMKQSDK